MDSVKSQVSWWLRNSHNSTYCYDLDIGWTFVLDFQTHIYFWSLRQ